MSDDFIERKKRIMALETDRGIDHIVEVASEIFGNPMVMIDTSYNLLSFTKGVEVSDDRLWNELTQTGVLSHSTVNFLKEEGFINVFAKSDVACFMRSDKLKYDRVNGILFDSDGIQLGNITVIALYKPLSDDDAKLLEIVSDKLSTALQNSEFYYTIDKVYSESFLNKLIDGKTLENEAERVEMAKLYEKLKSNFYLAAVDISHYEETGTQLAYFRDLFKKIQSDFEYFIHLDNVVVIMSTDKHMFDINIEMKELNAFFKQYNVFAGVSGVFHNLYELRKHYREAINALNYGLKDFNDSNGIVISTSQNIFRYDEIRVVHFLNYAKSFADINDIFSPEVLAIGEYDAKYGTNLVSLMYVYLSFARNVDMTCEKTGLTAGELQSKLDMLSREFGIDWNSGNMLANLFISIKMLSTKDF